MERTSIRLGGVELASSVMNASGPRSAERGEILELAAAHGGAVVFKSCNRAGLELPENLKNRGVEYFAAIARELTPRGKKVIAQRGRRQRRGIRRGRAHARSRRRQHRRAEPRRRLRDELGRAVRVVRAAQIPARPSARRDRMRARGESAAARAVRSARDRGPVQIDAHSDRGVRQRSAQGARSIDIAAEQSRVRRARSRRRMRFSTRARICSTWSQSAESTRAATHTSRT